MHETQLISNAVIKIVNASKKKIGLKQFLRISEYTRYKKIYL